jgi:hypothetical protein
MIEAGKRKASVKKSTIIMGINPKLFEILEIYLYAFRILWEKYL